MRGQCRVVHPLQDLERLPFATIGKDPDVYVHRNGHAPERGWQTGAELLYHVSERWGNEEREWRRGKSTAPGENFSGRDRKREAVSAGGPLGAYMTMGE